MKQPLDFLLMWGEHLRSVPPAFCPGLTPPRYALGKPSLALASPGAGPAPGAVEMKMLRRLIRTGVVTFS